MAGPEPKMTMLLSGPLEIQKSGRVSSVCLHPTKDLVASVHKDGALYYTIFAVSKEAGNKILTQPKQYNAGKHPSIALAYVEDDDKTIAIATHHSKLLKTIYCQIGIVNVDRQIIEWQRNLESGKGVKPNISASKNGTAALIYEEALSLEKLKCFIGKVDASSAVPKIEWKQTVLLNFGGVEPDVAVNDTTIVIISRNGFSSLQTKVGTIQPDCEVDWGPTLPLKESTGINPTISINSKGYVVEIHQSKALRSLTRNYGHILPDKTISWKQPSTYTQGEHPTVSINDDNFVFEMHKAQFNSTLFCSQGELRVTDFNDSRQPEEPQS